VDQIARRGRQRGFRLWTICQRPQELNKKALSQTSTMVLMRLRAPQDRKAAEAWMMGHGDKAQVAEISATLSSLQTGEGYVWAPDLDILERVQFPPITTLDNSATPKAGDKRPARLRLAKPDLKALQELLKPDPAPAEATPAPKREVRAASPAEIQAAEERGFTRGLVEGERRGHIGGWKDAKVDSAKRAQSIADEFLAEAGGATPASATYATPLPSSATAKPKTAGRVAAPATAPVGGDPALTGPQRQLLSALAWWKQMGHDAPSRPQIAGIAGWKITSGHLKNVVGSLKTAGLVEYPQPNVVRLTEAGAAAAPAPDMGATLHDGIRGILTGPQRAVFDVLVEVGGEMTRDALATRCGWEPTSGHLKNVIGSMKTLELVDYPAPGSVQLQAWVTA
jgi:hypothetical protein